jgi:peptidoglycan hydrolase CwlO-like protein
MGIMALVAIGMIGTAICQDTGNAGGRGARGGRGNVDPAQFRQQAEQRMKEQLGASDEEWKILQPKLDKVQTAQRDVRAGGMMGMMSARGGRGGPGGPGAAAGGTPPAANAPAQSEVQKKAGDLQKVLDNKDAKPEDIKTALTAYRDARTKAKADLEKAQKDLKEVLSLKQEAQLVMMGLLE